MSVYFKAILLASVKGM